MIPTEFMKELKKLTDEQQAVIVHEAGHAAMAIKLQLTPVKVELGSDGIGSAKVIPEFKGFSANDNKNRIAVLKAGFLAERRYTKKDIDHGQLDKHRVKNLLIEDCITDLELKIEKDVIHFLDACFDTKVLSIAELIACNYKDGKCLTETGELEHTYCNS
jgi:hypothetical protein